MAITANHVITCNQALSSMWLTCPQYAYYVVVAGVGAGVEPEVVLLVMLGGITFTEVRSGVEVWPAFLQGLQPAP